MREEWKYSRAAVERAVRRTLRRRHDPPHARRRSHDRGAAVPTPGGRSCPVGATRGLARRPPASPPRSNIDGWGRTSRARCSRRSTTRSQAWASSCARSTARSATSSARRSAARSAAVAAVAVAAAATRPTIRAPTRARLCAAARSRSRTTSGGRRRRRRRLAPRSTCSTDALACFCRRHRCEWGRAPLPPVVSPVARVPCGWRRWRPRESETFRGEARDDAELSPPSEAPEPPPRGTAGRGERGRGAGGPHYSYRAYVLGVRVPTPPSAGRYARTGLVAGRGRCARAGLVVWMRLWLCDSHRNRASSRCRPNRAFYVSKRACGSASLIRENFPCSRVLRFFFLGDDGELLVRASNWSLQEEEEFHDKNRPRRAFGKRLSAPSKPK